MRKQDRKLPLDLLPGFEAAARNLSFTKAAAELFLTQSAVSRQVQTLEDVLGTPLFQRRHRALLLTDAGQLLFRRVGELLSQLEETTRQIRGSGSQRLINVTTTYSFASLWLIPRLQRFRELYPSADTRISVDDAILELGRDRLDVAIRYGKPDNLPAQAVKLFGEEVMPMCSPKLLWERPLRSPQDLRGHILLHDDDIVRAPWLDWRVWLQAHGISSLQAAGELRFSHYGQMIQAAIEGQGVALGRLPLLADLMRRGQLVAPFERDAGNSAKLLTARAFYVIADPRAAARPEVQTFVNWVISEATADAALVPAVGQISKAKTRAKPSRAG